MALLDSQARSRGKATKMFRFVTNLIGAAEINLKLTRIFQARTKVAREHFEERIRGVFDKQLSHVVNNPMFLCDL